MKTDCDLETMTDEDCDLETMTEEDWSGDDN